MAFTSEVLLVKVAGDRSFLTLEEEDLGLVLET
jgi:hypothetical protein